MAVMSQQMAVLTSRNTDEWYTPPEIINRAYRVLGKIDLDPASDPIPQAWIRAERFISGNGLSVPWYAETVWLNPPYNGSTAAWVNHLEIQYQAGRVKQALLLINSAHGYKWYEQLWTAYPVCCLRERLRFVRPDGTVGGQAKKAQTIVYFGENVERFREAFEDLGRLLVPEVEK